MIKEIKLLLERYAGQYLDSTERKTLREGMEEIKSKLFNLCNTSALPDKF